MPVEPKTKHQKVSVFLLLLKRLQIDLKSGKRITSETLHAATNCQHWILNDCQTMMNSFYIGFFIIMGLLWGVFFYTLIVASDDDRDDRFD